MSWLKQDSQFPCKWQDLSNSVDFTDKDRVFMRSGGTFHWFNHSFLLSMTVKYLHCCRKISWYCQEIFMSKISLHCHEIFMSKILSTGSQIKIVSIKSIKPAQRCLSLPLPPFQAPLSSVVCHRDGSALWNNRCCDWSDKWRCYNCPISTCSWYWHKYPWWGSCCH